MTKTKTTTVQIVPRAPVVREPTEGKRLEPAMGPQIVRVSRHETEGAFEMIEIEVVAGAGPPLHVHPGFDEAFYILEGKLTMRIGERMLELGPRGAALVPAGTLHTWKNAGTTPVRFLQVTAPGSMEELLEAFAARPLASPEELAQLAEMYGTVILGPPL